MALEHMTGMPEAPELPGTPLTVAADPSSIEEAATEVIVDAYIEAQLAREGEVLGMVGDVENLQRCRWCSGWHPHMVCPHIAMIEYFENGTIKRIEVRDRSQGTFDQVFYSEDQVEAALAEDPSPPAEKE